MKRSECRRSLVWIVLAGLFMGMVQPAAAGPFSWWQQKVWNRTYAEQAKALGMNPGECADAAAKKLSPEQWQNLNKYAQGWKDVDVQTSSRDYMNDQGLQQVETIARTTDLGDGRVMTDIMRSTTQKDGTTLEEQFVVLQAATGEVLVGEGIVKVMKGAEVVKQTAITSQAELAKIAGNATKGMKAARAPAKGNLIKQHPYIAAGAGVAAIAIGAVALGGGGGGGGGGASDGGGGGGGAAGGVGRFAGTISGGMSGKSGPKTVSGGFIMRIGADGSVAFSWPWGSGSGRVSANGAVSVSGNGWLSGTITRSGNTLYGSGAWGSTGVSGSWSGSGPASQ